MASNSMNRRLIIVISVGLLILSAQSAHAQQGSDLGTIAQNFITYLGGAAGGYMAAAATMIVALLWASGILSGRHAVETVMAVALAWSASYLVRTTIGWAELAPLPYYIQTVVGFA